MGQVDMKREEPAIMAPRMEMIGESSLSIGIAWMGWVLRVSFGSERRL